MHIERVNARVAAARANIKFHCGSVTLFIFTVFGASLAFADAEKTLFDIEAQPAKTSLTLYAKQAKVQLGFAADIVHDILTNPVKGEYENAQALELLLEGTGLEAEHGHSGIIIRRTPKRVFTSEAEEPALNVGDTNNLQLMRTAVQGAARTSTGSAGISNDGSEETTPNLEEIVVTGSRIRGAQNVSPVVTITRQDINRAGFATVEEIVDKLPQNFGAGATLDTANDRHSSRNSVGGYVGNVAAGTSVNLRGLGAGSTLILLNGRRTSPSGLDSSFTDISGIPVGAIERVEILTDGASAIYGADAIAGVVNFILREDYEGAETRLRYGSDSGGDTSEILFGQSLGTSWGEGNLLVSYEYYEHDNLANIDRHFAASQDLTRFGGTDWRVLNGTGGNPGTIFDTSFTSYAIPTEQDGTALTAADLVPGTFTLNDILPAQDLLPETERHSVFITASQDIGTAELFAEARFSTREDSYAVDQEIEFLTVTDANPYFVDPSGTGQTSAFISYSPTPDLGPLIAGGKTDSYGATLGARFDIRNAWNADLVATWSKEDALQKLRNFVNDIALASALNQTDPELAFNPFGDGSNTDPAVIDRVRASSPGFHAENELWSVAFNVNGVALDWPGGGVKIAAGIEFREDALFNENTIGASQGAPVLVPGTDGTRDVFASYTEFLLPLVSAGNSHPGVRRLELSLAMRYENYSDFGSSTNPKIGLVWAPTDDLTLRGTYGTSFKAPSLSELDTTDRNVNLIRYLPAAFVPDFVPFPAIVRQGGNPDLKAEEAKTWTAGFQLRPERITGLSIDMTYFSVDFDDRIEVPFSNFLLGFSDARFASLLTLNPTQEQISALVNDTNFEEDAFGVVTPAEDLLSGAVPVGGILDARQNNLARSVVTGLDLLLSYEFETLLGSFDIGLNGNYLFDFERALIDADPLVDEVDTLGRPVDFRARGNFTWSRQAWSVTGFINYVDSYSDNVSNPTRPIHSWTTVDLSLSYDTRAGGIGGLLSDTRLSLTAQNLFDGDPPFADTFGGLGYDTANHNGMGRFVSFHVTKGW